MKKKIIVSLLVGVCIFSSLCVIGICTDSSTEQVQSQIEQEVATSDEQSEETNEEEIEESSDEEPEEEIKDDEEQPSETISNESDEESPNEMEDHYDELVNDKRMNDIQILAKALADASGRTYDDCWNDVYNCAITYGYEYAQNYANNKIQQAKMTPAQQSSGQQSLNDLLNHIDDWDYACIAYEYIPSGNVGGGSYAAEASKYSSYVEYYFSVPQQTRDQLKSLFKGQCPSITGEDSWRFQSEINGCGQELKEAIRAGLI